MKARSYQDRLKSAAIVKLKYELITGKIDDGFRTVFEGVLGDLELQEVEVDRYIEENRAQLTKICLDGDH